MFNTTRLDKVVDTGTSRLACLFSAAAVSGALAVGIIGAATPANAAQPSTHAPAAHPSNNSHSRWGAITLLNTGHHHLLID